jgi:hypothetical protein
MFFYNSKNLEIANSNSFIISKTNKDKYLVNSYLKERIYHKKQISLYLNNKIYDLYGFENNLYNLYLFR